MCSDEGLGVSQRRARHVREQVVLDLVVQAAEGEIRRDAAAHVAGRGDLAA